MISLKTFLEEYNDIIRQCEVMTYITRDSGLQKVALDDLEQLINKIEVLKDKSIQEKSEDKANCLLSLECATNSLRYFINMWLLLKQDEPDKAWDLLISAQNAAIDAIKAHSISSHLEEYYHHLLMIEKSVFPHQSYASCGFTVIEEYCSICDADYENCDHIAGKAYMGKFCYLIVRKADLSEVSIVQNPADKRCRATEMSVKGGYRNLMTWKIVDKKS